MDYEKKYKNALEWARQVMNGETGFIRNEVEEIFPELRESEDERIKKAIYNALKYLERQLSWDALDDIDILDAYSWLEKQGNSNNQNWKPSKEQIHALEFFVRSVGESGYASPYNNNTKLLFSLLHDLEKLEKQAKQEENLKEHNICDTCEDSNGCLIPCGVKLVEKPSKQNPTSDKRYEVKAGDSLSTVEGKPFDYEHATITQKDYAHRDYNEIDPHFGIPIEDLMSRNNPADKKELKSAHEDIELNRFEGALFTAFSYAWQQYLNGEKVNPAQWAKDNSSELLEAALEEYKPSWSEEDEAMFRYIGNAITCEESAKYLEEKGVNMIKVHSWLESLKPQPKQEWSENDEKMLDFCIKHYADGNCITWLESLKTKLGGK